MVILMDPLEDPDDILRANRSREKMYMFDVTFDYLASQVGPVAAWIGEHVIDCSLEYGFSRLSVCAGGGVQSYNQRAD